jgi:hypothetical protein
MSRSLIKEPICREAGDFVTLLTEDFLETVFLETGDLFCSDPFFELIFVFCNPFCLLVANIGDVKLVLNILFYCSKIYKNKLLAEFHSS